MRAMRVERPAPIESNPLRLVDLPTPEPAGKQVRLRIKVCGVCLTDLHVVEGDLPFRGAVIPGHQAIGTIDAVGPDVTLHTIGDTVGVAWLHETCGKCRFCQDGAENLCENAHFTGYDVNGGFAEYLLAPESFVYPFPERIANANGAPLLCAGIIGYRAFRLSGARKGKRLGLYGFGASAHITIQIARSLGCKVYVFTRSQEHRDLAKQLGAVWTGRAEDDPPKKMDASIIFAPAGYLVREALRVLEHGGKLALAGIHMSPTPELDYREHLYYERCVQSVANNTREDGRDLLQAAAEIPVTTHTETFHLDEANEVLLRLKQGKINGAAVIDLDAG